MTLILILQVLETSLNRENCFDYLDRACVFKADILISSSLKIALEERSVSTYEDDWKRLGKKHPELAWELAQYRVKK